MANDRKGPGEFGRWLARRAALGEVDLQPCGQRDVAVVCRPAMGQRIIFGALDGAPFVGLQEPDLSGLLTMRWSGSTVDRRQVTLVAAPMVPAGTEAADPSAPVLFFHLPLLTPHARRLFDRVGQANRLTLRSLTVGAGGAIQGLAKVAALELALRRA